MLFTNEIAEITHMLTDRYGGSANKNIGDAFLLAWKFKDQDSFAAGGKKVCKEDQMLADMSLFAFLKIIAKCSKIRHIMDYSRDEGLMKRMPGYRVKMGMGLH